MPPIPRRSYVLAAAFIALAAASIAGAPRLARADVPSVLIKVTNGVEVDGQDKFPDWIVLVFPGGPPSGRPVAWPALVEPGYQTVIDRKTLGTPRLWILPRAALGELEAAARENDDQVDGPVAALLRAKGVDCGQVDLVDTANVVQTTPEQRLVKYRLDDAAPGRCAMTQVGVEFVMDFKRPPSWARFGPRKKKADAGAPAVEPSASASAPAAPSAVSPASSVVPVPTAASSAGREPQVPERAKGCSACTVGEERDAGTGPAMLAGAALAALLRFRRARRKA
jgi:MYXO-CTERM domain-containing protein